jgi:hypothetical protein
MQSSSAAEPSTSTKHVVECHIKQDGSSVSGCDRSNFTDALAVNPPNIQQNPGPGKDPDRTTRYLQTRRVIVIVVVFINIESPLQSQ